MKRIVPIQHTNEPILATKLEVEYLSNDGYATIAWRLYAEDDSPVNNGCEYCMDEDYINCDGSEEFAYAFVVESQRNRGKMLELIP